MNMQQPGRLVPFQCRGPAENMALDQVLLESVAAGGPPTLRLYGWSEPTVSLGYFQSIAERDTHTPSRSRAVVRRATGGGAIVHHHELTYSIAVPLAVGQVGASGDLYRNVHQGFIDTLGDLSVSATRFDQSAAAACYQCPFLCFLRRNSNDLIVAGYKVLGSAQRKSRTAVLQHGSLILRASEYAPEVPGIAELTGKFLTIEQIGPRFTDRLGELLSLRFAVADLVDREHRRAAEISSQRFAASAWLNRR